MRKILLTSAAALAALSLAACGESAQNETSEAADTVAGDGNTMGEATSDLNAAFDAAENTADAVGETIGNAAEDVGNAAEAAADEVD